MKDVVTHVVGLRTSDKGVVVAAETAFELSLVAPGGSDERWWVSHRFARSQARF